MKKTIALYISITLSCIMLVGCTGSINPSSSSTSQQELFPKAQTDEQLAKEYEDAIRFARGADYSAYLNCCQQCLRKLNDLVVSGNRDAILEMWKDLDNLSEAIPSNADTPYSCMGFYGAIHEMDTSLKIALLESSQAATATRNRDSESFNEHIKTANDEISKIEGYTDTIAEEYERIIAAYKDLGGDPDTIE